MARLEAIHADLTAAVQAIQPWRYSRWAPGLFGSDPQDALSQSFAIDIAETTATGNIQQLPSEGAWCQTAMILRYCIRLRADGVAIDYPAAFVLERQVVAACVALHEPDYTVALERIEARDTSREGYLFGSARFIVHHLYDLSL
jgi:hypothetical protein